MFPRPSSKRRSGSQGSGGGAAESKVEAAGSLAGLGRSRQVALLLVAEAQRCSAFNSPSRGNFASIPACLLKRCHGVRSPLRRSRLRCKRRAGRLLCWVRRQLGLAGNFDWILINAESLWVRRGSLIDLGMSVQLGPDAKKKRSCVESALAPVPLSLSLPAAAAERRSTDILPVAFLAGPARAPTAASSCSLVSSCLPSTTTTSFPLPLFTLVASYQSEYGPLPRI